MRILEIDLELLVENKLIEQATRSLILLGTNKIISARLYGEGSDLFVEFAIGDKNLMYKGCNTLHWSIDENKWRYSLD